MHCFKLLPEDNVSIPLQLPGNLLSGSTTSHIYFWHSHAVQVNTSHLRTQLRAGSNASALPPPGPRARASEAAPTPPRYEGKTAGALPAGERPGAGRGDAAGGSGSQPPHQAPLRLGARPRGPQGSRPGRDGRCSPRPKPGLPLLTLALPASSFRLRSSSSASMRRASRGPGGGSRAGPAPLAPPTVTAKGAQNFRSWPPQRLLPTRPSSTANREAALASTGQ